MLVLHKKMKRLTLNDIETIIHRDEGRTLEVKKTTAELTAGMQSGCAFLNTEGGWVFFGIPPQSLTTSGQDVVDKTMQDIAREMRKMSPAIDLSAQYIDVPDRPGKQIIAIWFPAPEAYCPPYTYDSRPYYKVENTTMIMPREMFDERIRLSNNRKFSWEKAPCQEVDIKEIGVKTLDDVIMSGINKGRIPREAARLKSRQAKLDHLGLRTEDGELSNGAVVLFGKAPDRVISQCKVRLARFEGTNMDKFRDQTICGGNLFEQYDAIISFCQKHMFLSGEMEQIERVDTLTLPFKALREATLNLLVHRTWWSGSRTPSVAIFDDRIEFMNPGSFPYGTTAEDFLKRPHSEPINEIISNVFFKSGLMEAWGRGIPNIFEECKKAGLSVPKFEVIPNFVCLTIDFNNPLRPFKTGDRKQNERLNESLNESLNERLNLSLKATLDCIIASPGISKRDIVATLRKSDATIGRHLSLLTKKEIIEHKGSKKTGGYYAKKQ